MLKRLAKDFYEKDAECLARNLLGKVLVRKSPKGTMALRIVETEAYLGPRDLASHTAKGRTKRNEVLFHGGGHSYVFLIYGMYYMFNVSAGPENSGQGVLLRAGQPLWGEDLMLEEIITDRLVQGKKSDEKRMKKDLAKGPGKLCKALGITMKDHWKVLYEDPTLGIYEDGFVVDDQEIVSCPRIGIDYAGPDKDRPYRFYLKGNSQVSVTLEMQNKRQGKTKPKGKVESKAKSKTHNKSKI